MKLSGLLTLVLTVICQVGFFTLAIPITEQQCEEQFGVSPHTITVTATHAVTKTVTFTATEGHSTSTASTTGSKHSGHGHHGHHGHHNNGGNNSGSNNISHQNSGGNTNNNHNSGSSSSSGTKSGNGSGTENSGSKNGNGNKGNSNSGSSSSSSGGNSTNNNNNNKGNSGNDPQTSLQLDPSVICANCAHDGLGVNGTEAGQAPSATSTNNFINFCLGKTIQNGLQNKAGSCNSIPQGDIPAKSKMIKCKFASPGNFATLKANTAFAITLAVDNFQTGAFTNPQTNYFAAPQQLNPEGLIIGHSHFVIQLLDSLQDTQPKDPNVFAFFQGVNAPAVDGKLTVSVAKGLPAGVYRIASINTASTHQPALVPVAQHGSIDDMIYITVVDDNGATSGSDNPALSNSAVAQPIASLAATASISLSSLPPASSIEPNSNGSASFPSATSTAVSELAPVKGRPSQSTPSSAAPSSIAAKPTTTRTIAKTSAR